MNTLPSNALITGASRRVGREIALYLARRGYNIAIHCRKEDKDSASLTKTLAKLGVKSTVITAELTDITQVDTVVTQARRALGAISCLINNASLYEKDNLVGLHPDLFSQHVVTNVYAPMALTRDFASQCNRKHDNCIINILDSCVGLSISPNYLSYAMSRNSLGYFTQIMTRQLAPHIRINAVGIGLTLPGKQDTPAMFARLAKRAPLQRTSSPAEVCTAIGFILDSPSVTGQIIALSGGYDASSHA